MQFTCVFLCRYEAANVCAPVRNSCQASIDRDRHMCFECFPGRIDITRPKECCIALYDRLSVAMQSKRLLIRTQLSRAYVVHKMTSQSTARVKTVTLIGPPTINAGVV